MSDQSHETVPAFLRIPTEIRLTIYKLLLSDHDDKALRIRTEDPSVHYRRKHEQRLRRKFSYIADRMRSRIVGSTYYLKRAPGQHIHNAVLGVNRQIHAEASHVLYSGHIFDFDIDIESIVPFLSDLTPPALSSIRHVRMVKRALPYTKDFDRCEWRNACAFIAEHIRSHTMRLMQLDLDVLGGTPSLANKPALHWNQRHVYTKSDFGLIMKLEEKVEDMEWINHVVAITGLQRLNVKAVLEHCPIPGSARMGFFVSFSASIEKGLAEYLRSLMFVQRS